MGNLLYEEEMYIIRGICFEIYKKIGYSHKEIIYQNALFEKLKEKNIFIEKEKKINIYLDNKKIGYTNLILL